MNEFITVKQLSQRINIPEWSLRDYARKKIFPAYKIGAKIFFNYEEVEKAIKKNKI